MPSKKRSALNAPQARGEAFARSVLDATILQLSSVGYERLSIPQIAELASVNKTSIYRRWPNKALLVQDALLIAMSHTNEVPDTGALRGDLVALAQTVTAFMQSRVGTALIRIMLAEGGNADLRALATAAYGEVGKRGPWIVVQRALKRGELNDNVDPSVMLFTIAGAMLHKVFVEHSTPSDEYLAQVVDLVLVGALAR
jgi:AcrR family transcriptional regulator